MCVLRRNGKLMGKKNLLIEKLKNFSLLVLPAGALDHDTVIAEFTNVFSGASQSLLYFFIFYLLLLLLLLIHCF